MSPHKGRARSIHPPAAVRRPAPQPRLFPRLLPIFILGTLAISHIFSLARLSELECERQRLERLILEQRALEAELLKARRVALSSARLTEYAERTGMVSPGQVKTLQLGLLPAPRVHWELPEEGGGDQLGEGLQLGQVFDAGPGQLP